MIAVRTILWLVLGAAGVVLGAVVLRSLSGGGGKLGPRSLAESAGSAVSGLGAAAQAFVTDVRLGMAEHEAVLREAAELDGGRLSRPATS